MTAAAEPMENLSYLCSDLLMYTVASPDPDPYLREGGQLPNTNECNSTLTSIAGGTYPHPDNYIYRCSLVVWNLGSPCNLRAEDTHICTVSSTSFPGLY